MHRSSREQMTSLRPRPVTATVTKPRWMQPEALARPRSASLESRGSTASLTSVLDHESCGSISDDEERDRDRVWEEERRGENKENLQSGAPHVTGSNLIRYAPNREKKGLKKKVLRKFVEPSQSEDIEETEPSLSPWEQWLIEKVKEDRMKRREEREKKKQELQRKQEEEAEQQRKLRKAEEIRKEWVERKTFEEQLKKKLEKQRLKTEKMIVQEEKKMVDVKAERKFQEWIENKKIQEREKKKEEKRKQQEEENRLKEQRLKAQQKYDDWLRKSSQKPKPPSNSFGYTSGKLTGYHDTSAYPVPAFYNPIPWHQPHVPKSSSDKRSKKKRPKSAYVWNPSKYL